MPESDPRKAIVQSTLLGLLGDVPGLGALAGAIQGAAEAASRARDEEWWAMVSARLTSLAELVQAMVDFSDPEFVAAAHRLIRAARESADDDKREMLAAALAHSGSWSDLPRDERERMERLVISLSSREVFVLRVMTDPAAWLAENDPDAVAVYNDMLMGSPLEFVHGHIIKGVAEEEQAVKDAIADLQAQRLLGMGFDTIMTGSGILQSRATQLGRQFIAYLQRIGA